MAARILKRDSSIIPALLNTACDQPEDNLIENDFVTIPW